MNLHRDDIWDLTKVIVGVLVIIAIVIAIVIAFAKAYREDYAECMAEKHDRYICEIYVQTKYRTHGGD